MVRTETSNTFANRYAAVWNEPDPAARRKAIADLWAEDGVEFTGSEEHRGHEAIEVRVAGAQEKFLATGEFVFTLAGDAVSQHNAVTFTTHMVPTAGGDAVWTGFVFALLGDDGRIEYDYQFVAKETGTRATVADFLHRLRDGDPDRIAEVFAETVDWQLDWPAEGHPAVPWIRPRSNRADVADHFRALEALHRPEKRGASTPRILVDGSDAVVLADIQQTVKATNRSYTARCALYLTVEDGLITRYHVYEDSLTVAEALVDERAHR